MKQHFSAGEVGRAIGEDAITLRQWRTRKICAFGEMGDRGHWQYSFFEVCQIAVATSLVRFGWSAIEVAMNAVENGAAVREAIAKAVVGDTEEQFLFLSTGVSPAGIWSSRIITTAEARGTAADQVEAQWAAYDGISGCEDFLAEGIWQINVSRIVSRVERLLRQ